MIRLGSVLWMLLAASIGYAMFQVKYEVAQLDEQLVRIHRDIAADQESIHVLKAEWAFLTQPKRLDELSKRYLALSPIGTAKLGALDAAPMRAVKSDPEATPSPGPTPPTKPAPARLAEISDQTQP
jgi:hypothetical protein